jgi:hypothetical protein
MIGKLKTIFLNILNAKLMMLQYCIICSLLLFACNKCEETTKSPSRVDQSDIPILFPYNGRDKVKFLKNKTDTVIFYKTDLVTTYNYTTTQEDCPSKIPLEQKYLNFIDSVEGNNFTLFYFVDESLYSSFRIIINNQTIADGSPNQFIMPYPPIKSTTILGLKYDTTSTWCNMANDSVTYKTLRYGVLRFTSNKNTFELIPE